MIKFPPLSILQGIIDQKRRRGSTKSLKSCLFNVHILWEFRTFYLRNLDLSPVCRYVAYPMTFEPHFRCPHSYSFTFSVAVSYTVLKTNLGLSLEE
jgi:hypothetical protein